MAKRSKFRHHGEFEGEFESFLELMSDKMSRSSHLRFIAWGPGALKWHRSHSSPCQLKDILTILGHKTKKNVLSSTNLKHIACGSALVDIKWFIEDSEITAHEVTSSLRRFGVVAGLIFNSAVKDKIESFAIRSSRLEKKMEPADLMKYYNTALQNFFFDFLQLSESMSDRMHGSDSEILLFWSTRLPTLGYSVTAEILCLIMKCLTFYVMGKQISSWRRRLLTVWQLWVFPALSTLVVQPIRDSKLPILRSLPLVFVHQGNRQWFQMHGVIRLKERMFLL